MLVKLNGEFFAKRRAPASFRLAKKFGEIAPGGVRKKVLYGLLSLSLVQTDGENEVFKYFLKKCQKKFFSVTKILNYISPKSTKQI
jgi:hypothetical protein